MKGKFIHQLLFIVMGIGLLLLLGCPNNPVINPVYTVSFESNGGTDIKSVSIMHGQKITAPAAPDKYGYIFTGWYSNAALTNAWDFKENVVTVDMTLYAAWLIITHTVSFESNGGTDIEAVSILHGQKITAPAAPVKDGYEFASWYADIDLTDAWVFETDVVTAGMTLYASWRLPTFTVTFDTNGGPSSIASQSVTRGGTAVFPGAPGRDGYGFAGWYADADLTDEWNFSTDTVTKDLTLYVKWTTIVYTITYNLNGGNLTGQTTQYTILDSNITLVEPAKTDYVFGGWYEDSGFGGGPVTVISAGSFGYREYYARWLANVTITFNSNGGSGSMAAQEAVEGIAEALDANSFTAPSSSGFAGWSTDANATEAEYTDGGMFTAGASDVSLYAVWKSWYTYEILTGGTTISLTGFSDYYNNSTNLIIPSLIDGYTVTKIGDNSFGYNRQITSIIFPGTLTEIGYGAFQYNSSLASITLGSSLSSISGNAFTYTAISTVSFPASLEYLTTTAFRNCAIFTAYTVEAGNTKYSASNGILYNLDQTTVYHCPPTKTGSFDIPSTVTRIDQYAYENCKQLENLVLPAGLTDIGYSAFQNCDGITSVSIPEGVSYLTSDVFRGCDALESVQLPASLTGLASDRAFMYTPSLANITVAAGNTSYASVNGVLYNADKTTLLVFPAAKDAITYTFPSTLESLNDYCFSGYQGESIVVPEGVTFMGYGVFIAIESTSITFPSTITSIGSQLAVNSSNLATIIINAETPPSLGQYAPFGRSNASGLQVRVPAASVSAYQSAADWVSLDVAQYVVSQ